LTRTPFVCFVHHHDSSRPWRTHVYLMTAWLVGYTKPSCENKAQTFLQASGVEVYVPRFKKSDRVIKGRLVEDIRPLFSRYIFIRDSQRDPVSLRYQPGMIDLLRRSDGLGFVRLHEEVVGAIKDRETDQGLLETETLGRPNYRSGDELIYKDYDFLVEFARFKNCNYAEVFFPMLGSVRSMVVRLADLKPAK